MSLMTIDFESQYLANNHAGVHESYAEMMRKYPEPVSAESLRRQAEQQRILKDAAA